SRECLRSGRMTPCRNCFLNGWQRCARSSTESVRPSSREWVGLQAALAVYVPSPSRTSSGPSAQHGVGISKLSVGGSERGMGRHERAPVIGAPAFARPSDPLADRTRTRRAIQYFRVFL